MYNGNNPWNYFNNNKQIKMSKEPKIIGRIISTEIKEIDYSNVVPKFMSIEESIENIKKSFQFEEDKTLMNKLIEELLNQNKDEI